MSKKKTDHVKSYREKTLLDSLLWFIENYLPQKDKRSSHKGFHLNKLDSEIINKMKKLAFNSNMSLNGDLRNTKVTFTVGKWALPYLNFLKKINLLK
tara:strand:+ start:122 stop:412 length:291 start_codon:yes stop_codon:yes gene_type:complete